MERRLAASGLPTMAVLNSLSKGEVKNVFVDAVRADIDQFDNTGFGLQSDRVMVFLHARNLLTDSAAKSAVSEALGEEAGLRQVRELKRDALVAGGASLADAERMSAGTEWRKTDELSAAIIEADFAFVPGVPWDEPLVFDGSGVPNMTYWDGKKYHVIECKGGTSDLGSSRVGKKDGVFQSASQGTWVYLEKKGEQMQKPRAKSTPEQNAVREAAGIILEDQLECEAVVSGVAKCEFTSKSLQTMLEGGASSADVEGLAKYGTLTSEQYEYPATRQVQKVEDGRLVFLKSGKPAMVHDVAHQLETQQVLDKGEV